MHFDNLFFLILIAIAGALRWAMQQAQNSRKRDGAPKEAAPPPGRAIPSRDADTDEERVRRFLEALGQPRGAQPPERVKPRTKIVPRRSPIRPIDPFPRPEIGPLTGHPVAEAAPPPDLVQLPSVPSPLPNAAIPAVRSELPGAPRVYEVESEEEARAGWTMPDVALSRQPRAMVKQNTLTALLRSPAGIRNAILLREIFGQPRSLQPFDPTQTF